MVAILSHISGKVVQYYIIYLIIYVPFGKLSNEKVIYNRDYHYQQLLIIGCYLVALSRHWLMCLIHQKS